MRTAKTAALGFAALLMVPADGMADVGELCGSMRALELHLIKMLDGWREFDDYRHCDRSSTVCQATMNRLRRDTEEQVRINRPRSSHRLKWSQSDLICGTQVDDLAHGLYVRVSRFLAELNARYPP